jgi:hypothetical protein
VLAAVVASSAAPAASPGDVWYGPKTLGLANASRARLFPLLSTPSASWPSLAARTSTVKLFLDMLYEWGAAPGTGATDDELRSLIAALRQRKLRVGLEVGGVRWGNGLCNASAALAYAAREQSQAARWLALGGTIHSLTTDHAIVWNIRGTNNPNPDPHKASPNCIPPVPVAQRVDAVAQVFGSWRSLLGASASLGFIESLGFWEIAGADGTNFTNTDPAHLNNITGWIPKLGDVTALLLAAAARHNPTPAVPLLDHFQIDYATEGVEYDTRAYGAARSPAGLNYNRILGAEAIMRQHGLATGVIANAFPAKPRAAGCLVGCDPSFTPSHSAAVRTLNFSRGYMQQPSRGSAHAVLEQWQPAPSEVGPETTADTGMWMASRAAAILLPNGASAP